MFKLAILITTLLFVSTAFALSDPTRPSGFRAAPAKEQALQLETILIGEQRKIAVINGKALTEGERIGEATVVQINKHKVQVKKAGKMINLEPRRISIRQEK